MSTGESISVEGLLQHEGWMRRLALELVRDEIRAEDLVQETWLAAAERPPAPGHARGWLAQVVRRGAAREARTHHRRERRERAVARRDATVDDAIERVHLQREIVSVLLDLPERYRRPLVLRYFEDLSPPAVAARLDAPLETIRTRLRRGLAMIRDELGTNRSAAERRGALLLCAGAAGAFGRETAVSTFAGGTMMAASTKTVSLVVALSLLLVAFAGWRLLGDDGGEDELAHVGDGTRTGVEAPRRSEEPSPGAVATSKEEPDRSVAGAGPAPTRAPAEADGSTLVVRVVGPDDVPVPGATVFVDELSEGGSGSIADLLELTRSHARGMLDGAPADAGGRVERTLETATRRICVGAFHEGVGYGFRGPVAVEGARTEIEIALRAGVVVHGTVTDEDGVPMEGIRVGIAGSLDGKSFSNASRASTGADGVYRTYPLPYLEYSIDASADGHRNAFSRVLAPLPDQRELRYDLVLERARVVTGRLLLADGGAFELADQARTVAGERAEMWLDENDVQVFADYDDPGDDPNFLSLGHTTGEVDTKDAAYRIELDNRHLDWISVWIGASQVAASPLAEGVTELDLVVDTTRLPPPPEVADLEIRVVDAKTGAAVPAWAFEISTGISGPRQRGTSDRGTSTSADGRLVLEGLRTGRATLEVTAESRAPAWRALELTGGGSMSSVTIAMHPSTGVVRGLVRDAANAPVGGALVRFLRDTGALVGPPDDVATTDEKGRFALTGIAPLRGYVAVTADGFAPALVTADARPGAPPLEVELVRGLEIVIVPKGANGPFSFRFLDARGLPFADDAYTSVRRWGSGFGFRVPDADLILETRVPGYVTSRLAFHPRATTRLEPELVRE